MTDQTDARKNYAEYLALDALLTAQLPMSEHLDELHFIIIHQVHELWFKLAIHYLERVRDAMDADDILEATRLLTQVAGMFENAQQTTQHLHTLPPMAFHRFRLLLAPGSGLQSYQFREIEFLCGLRDERHVKWVQRVLPTNREYESVWGRLQQPSINEAFRALLERHNIDAASVYATPEEHPALYQLCDVLSVLDQRIIDWRFAHIQLVERTIGTSVTGTGGTMHDYLRSTLDRRLFPELWEARNILSARVNQGAKLT